MEDLIPSDQKRPLSGTPTTAPAVVRAQPHARRDNLVVERFKARVARRHNIAFSKYPHLETTRNGETSTVRVWLMNACRTLARVRRMTALPLLADHGPCGHASLEKELQMSVWP